jgi:uncharacterized protein
VKVVALFLTMLTVTTLANASSFDCKKAATYVEKEICSDTTLGKLDDALSENYNAMLATDLGDGGKELKKTQRAWLAVRNKCATNKCLVDTYRLRVDEVCDAPVVSGVHAMCTQSSEIISVTGKSTGTTALSSPQALTAQETVKMIKEYSKNVKAPQKYLGRTYSGSGDAQKANKGSGFQIQIAIVKLDKSAWCKNVLGVPIYGPKINFVGTLDGEVFSNDEVGEAFYLKDCKLTKQ